MSKFIQQGQINEKRFYIDFETMCPVCGDVCTVGDDYLTSPSLEDLEDFEVFCDTCDDYFGVKLKLTLTVEVIDE